MTYCQAKDLMILEGDGRTDAELYRWEHLGSTPTYFAMRKIFFWPRSNRFKVDGARSLNLNQMPGGEWKSGARLPVLPAPPPREATPR
jgi:hypothetical protein